MSGKTFRWITILACLLASGCSTIPQQVAVFPQAPQELLQPPPPLQKLPGDAGTPINLGDATTTIVTNYGQYYQIAEELLALQDWVKQQEAVK
jgi:hypothetical protein